VGDTAPEHRRDEQQHQDGDRYPQNEIHEHKKNRRPNAGSGG
jgi:hypothetical protein